MAEQVAQRASGATVETEPLVGESPVTLPLPADDVIDDLIDEWTLSLPPLADELAEKFDAHLSLKVLLPADDVIIVFDELAK